LFVIICTGLVGANPQLGGACRFATLHTERVYEHRETTFF